MSGKHTLRQKARDAIRERRLPRRQPERMWGGPGTGVRCAICNEPVRSDDIEFELEFPPAADHPGRGNPRVHAQCFSEWEIACRDLERVRETMPSRPDVADRGAWRQSH